MAWTQPKTWQNLMVDDDQLNAQLKDNMNVLSTHTHTGAGGFGSASLAITVLSTATQTIWNFVDQEANPDAVGELQRNGNDLFYFNGTIAGAVTQSDQATSIPSLRTLGTGATQAATGNHTH
tara:strand:- start:34 stop:399 length:366 start_codon:yes stop_codon:yes gene_type:complete